MSIVFGLSFCARCTSTSSALGWPLCKSLRKRRQRRKPRKPTKVQLSRVESRGRPGRSEKRPTLGGPTHVAHDTLSLLSPASFLRLARETGTSRRIDLLLLLLCFGHAEESSRTPAATCCVASLQARPTVGQAGGPLQVGCGSRAQRKLPPLPRTVSTGRPASQRLFAFSSSRHFSLLSALCQALAALCHNSHTCCRSGTHRWPSRGNKCAPGKRNIK